MILPRREEILPWIKPGLIVATAACSCIAYTFLSPPLITPETLATLPFLGSLPPDRAGYWARFAASGIFLGILPACVLAILGLAPADAGLRLPRRGTLRSPLFLAAMALAFGVGVLGGITSPLAAFYPYARHLLAQAAEPEAAGLMPGLALHFAAYFFLYYGPWEFFFRGFLLFPAAEAMGKVSARQSGARIPAGLLAAAVFAQTIPSAMLHIGHPAIELFAAVPAGLVFGILAWKTNSILPGLFLHTVMGFGTDLAILAGVLWRSAALVAVAVAGAGIP